MLVKMGTKAMMQLRIQIPTIREITTFRLNVGGHNYFYILTEHSLLQVCSCVLLLTNNGINVAAMITAKIIMTVSDNRCNVKLFLQSGNPQSVSKCFAKKGGDGWENF